MARIRKKYVCQDCGHVTTQWFGRCPGCEQWNTLVEELTLSTAGTTRTVGQVGSSGSGPIPLPQLSGTSDTRQSTGFTELDRILGGGIVSGSVVLVGGEPGAGKSTLLLQVAGWVAAGGRDVLYVSGEESGSQIRLRAERLGTMEDTLFVLTETDVEAIISHMIDLEPALCIVDSIQTIVQRDITSAPGSITQVRSLPPGSLVLPGAEYSSLFGGSCQ